jgi:hypothetical protein
MDPIPTNLFRLHGAAFTKLVYKLLRSALCGENAPSPCLELLENLTAGRKNNRQTMSSSRLSIVFCNLSSLWQPGLFQTLPLLGSGPRAWTFKANLAW